MAKCPYFDGNRGRDATHRLLEPSRQESAREKGKGERNEGGQAEIWRQANNRGSIAATFRRRRLRLMFIHMSRTWYGAPEEEAAAAAGGDVL